MVVVLKRTVGLDFRSALLLFSPIDLSAESVQSASLALEGVDHVHRSDRLALRVLAVRHRVTNHVLQEHLQLVEFDGELPFFEPTLSTPRVSS